MSAWASPLFLFVGSRGSLRSLDVGDGDLPGATIHFGVVGHLLAFGEAANPSALKRCRMDKNVLAAVVWRDKAEALLIIVELNCTCIH